MLRAAMANEPQERPKRLFAKTRFTTKLKDDFTIRTPFDKWMKRAPDRIPIKGTVNGEVFKAKLDFKTHPDAWWDVDIDPEGYYEIFLNSPTRYMLRRVGLKPGLKLDVEIEYDYDQYAIDDAFKARTNARAAAKRAAKRKAEGAAARAKKKSAKKKARAK